MARRRNPDYLNLALLGAIGVGLYVLYTTLKSAPAAISNAQQAAGSKVADWFDFLLPGTTTLPAGTTIVLGTDAEIPASAAQAVAKFTDTDNTAKYQFFYAGQTWRTTSTSPDDANAFYATAS